MVLSSPGDPRRPYPTDLEMRSGLLGLMANLPSNGVNGHLPGDALAAGRLPGESCRSHPTTCHTAHHLYLYLTICVTLQHLFHPNATHFIPFLPVIGHLSQPQHHLFHAPPTSVSSYPSNPNQLSHSDHLLTSSPTLVPLTFLP